QASHVARVSGHAFGVSRNPAVPGSTPDFFHARTLLQLPHQCVLAPASANHQNLHWGFPRFTTLSNDRRDPSACQSSAFFEGCHLVYLVVFPHRTSLAFST